MIGKMCGRMIFNWAVLLVLWITALSAGNLIAQNTNAVLVSSTDVIGSSLPTVQRPIRGPAGRLGQNTPPTTTGGMSYQIQFARESVVGYVATKITIRSQSKFASDREWVFRFHGVDDQVYPPRRNLLVDVPVSVQQGTASQTFTRYLPRWAITRQISIDVLEEGRVVPELSALVGSPQSSGVNPSFQNVNNSNLRYPAIALQSEQHMNSLIVIGGNKPTEAESGAVQSFFDSARTSVELQPVNRMPTDWRAYQRFDVIVLSSSLCEQLVELPDALNAVRQWLMIGGTILVHGNDDPAAIMNKLGVSNAPKKIPGIRIERIERIVANWDQYWTQTEENIQQTAEAIANATPAELATGSAGIYGYSDLTPQQYLERLKNKQRGFRQAKTRTSQQWSQRIWMRRVAAGQVLGLQVPDLP